MSNKEQLLNELEQIKNQQKKLAEKLENIQKQIENEEENKKWWTPKKGDGYWYIKTNGNIEYNSYTKMEDVWRENNINAYKTKEQAERQAFEELLHRKLKKFAYENNEEEIDWNNDNFKYYIGYDNNHKQLCVYNTVVYKHIGQVYFTSEEITEKAIEEFKDDLLRYFASDK